MVDEIPVATRAMLSESLAPWQSLESYATSPELSVDEGATR